MHRTILLIFALLLLPAAAFAHAIGVTCTIRSDKVEVEAFFDDDTPAFKAKVQIVDIRDEVIATGFTDKNGIWTFATPAPGRYDVRIDAGAGHRATKVLIIPGAETEAPAKSDPPPIIAAPEPTREEQTRTPWLRIGIGLAIIFAVGVAVMGLMQWRAANQKR